MVRPEGEAGTPAPGMGAMGMAVFLASLTMLFLAGVAGFLVIRFTSDAIPPPAERPSLPVTLWVSTGLLAVCSAAMQSALTGIRRGNQAVLRAGLAATGVLAGAYLISQVIGWSILIGGADFTRNLWGFLFFMVTALHWVHVLGGVAAVAVAGRRAWLGEFTWASYALVRHTTVYWHFLAVVWVVILALLVLT